jgi:hypothetical protein
VAPALAGLVLLVSQTAASADDGTRDPFLQPFASTSPWNTPIGSGAQYEAIPGIESYPAGINFNERWTTGIYRATSSDRQATLYIYKGNLWALLAHAKKLTDPATNIAYVINTTGNDPAAEKLLRDGSQATNLTPANFYSTTVRSPTGQRTWPTGLRDLQTGWTNSIFLPAGAVPSADSDAHIAVFQPTGLVLECYDAIVCGNGDIICAIAGFSDPTGDGAGDENGRCASLTPNYAGKIRARELDLGQIPHALCALAPAKLLKPDCVWPACAFDMNDGYSGPLPMGSLLAIPPSVDITALGLSPKGLAIARAAQDYGVYLTDRGGDGVTIQAELGTKNLPGLDADIAVIVHHLQRVTNNGPAAIGGGGTPRAALAPPLASQPSN